MTVKLCECGCGLPAPLAQCTNKNRGMVKGMPFRFRQNHRKRRAHDLTRFKVVDAGYQTECWIWLGSLGKNGYGHITVRRYPRLAHRVSFEAANGPIPDGLQLDHLCRNRACIRPDHLERVTCAQNIRRGLSTKLSKEQVLLIREDTRPTRKVGLIYGISNQQVSRIRTGKTWRTV